jgi:hypothetical protein
MSSLIIKWEKIVRGSSPVINGLLLAIGVAVIARLLHSLIPGPVNKAVSDIVIAVLLGLFIRNVVGVSGTCESGIKFALTHVLRLGIILLGLRLSLQDIPDPAPSCHTYRGGNRHLRQYSHHCDGASHRGEGGRSQLCGSRYHTLRTDCRYFLPDHRAVPGPEQHSLRLVGGHRRQ